MSPVSPLNAMSRHVTASTPAASRARHNAELQAQGGLPGPQERLHDHDEEVLQELLSVPARLVSGMPVPVSLQLRVPGAPVPVVLWTGQQQRRESTPVLADMVVFDGAELEAIVSACEADRLWHSDFLGLCFEKWRTPDVPVRAAELLGGANAEPDAGWSLGRVLSRLGIEVETVQLDVEPVARPLHAAA